MKIGDKIPDVLGFDQSGKLIQSKDLIGKKIVLYFYPKDNTPGCSAEACSLKENWTDLSNKGYKIIGVSADTMASHQKFIDKYELPFDLIADTDRTLITQFRVWGEKKMMGKTYDGILRTTFLVNEEGIVTDIINAKDIKTKIHGIQLIEYLNNKKNENNEY